MWQKRLNVPLFALITIAMPVLVPYFLWDENLWVSFWVNFNLRFCITLNIAFCVNSVAHLYGSKPFDKWVRAQMPLLRDPWSLYDWLMCHLFTEISARWKACRWHWRHSARVGIISIMSFHGTTRLANSVTTSIIWAPDSLTFSRKLAGPTNVSIRMMKFILNRMSQM